MNIKLQNKIIAVLVLWQLVSVGLMITGVWPTIVALFTTGILALAFVVLPKLPTVQLFLVSLPFFVALPKLPIADFPMWRILAAWLFVVIVGKVVNSAWQPALSLTDNIKSITSQTYARFAPWDKWLALLSLFAAASLLFARFPVHGAKQILFLINAYLVYVVIKLVVVSQEESSVFKRYVLYSLLITVVLGFVQYAATLFSSPYYFWQYWATFASSVYFGQSLASVLSYSNSWFSAGGAGQSLRMFGVLQDTHAFAVVAFFALALWLTRARGIANELSVVQFLRRQTFVFWLGVVLLCFAIIAAGTRGVWVAMLVPATLAAMMLFVNRVRLFAVLPLVGYGVVVALFALSPFIASGLNLIRSMDTDDNFLDRAESIYDLGESSNIGRLEIWKESLRYAVTHPLGTGYGNFISSVISNIPTGASFEQVASQENSRYNLPQKFITAHSLFLHLLVELGIIGLLLASAVFIVVLKFVYNALKQVKFAFTNSSFVMVSVMLALIWLLAYGLFDVAILNDRVLLYTFMLLAILSQHAQGDILKQSK